MGKRVLIVDDDKEILTMLRYSLKKLGDGYEIITAQGSVEGLSQIEKNPFDLVIIDYMMKSMTGVDLARAVRRISPDTPIVIMSAYGNKRLRDTTNSLGLDGFLDKPFDLKKIRTLVQSFTEERTAAPVEPRDTSRAVLEQIRKQMQGLLVSASARAVMLLSADGYPVQLVGQLDERRIAKISAVIAANFMGTSELASQLGNKMAFRSSFHAGDEHNIYIYDVDGSFLLTVVFDARRKPGVIWFYAKQTASTLAPLLKQPPKQLLVPQPQPGNGASSKE